MLGYEHCTLVQETILSCKSEIIQFGKGFPKPRVCPYCFVLTMLLLCFPKRWKERLAKEGSLAPRTREKFSANFKGVTAYI